MAGMKDDTGRSGQARCLAEDHLVRLQSMIDESMDALEAVPLQPGDVLAVERKTRAVGVMARSIKLVDGLRRKPGRTGGGDQKDQDMNDDPFGAGDDVDLADAAAVRAELESRLHWIRSVIDRKRMAGQSDRGAEAGPAEADAEAA